MSEAMAEEKKNEPKKVNMLAPVGSKLNLQLMLERKRDGIVALVGDARIKRFTSIMLAMTNRHPELLECTMDSVLNAIQHCALIGLMPGPRGDIYLIPFRNKKIKGRKEISVIHGYKGLMRLGLQHKSVANVEAECVYEDDEFFFDAGERTILHRYPANADHDPDKIIGAWSRVWFKDNPRPSVLYYNKAQLDAKRKKSAQPDGNFWRDNPAAMYRKTVIRGHYNGGEIPMTDELSAAMDRELEEEFKEADVVSVSTAAPGAGVAAAKSAIGMGDGGGVNDEFGNYPDTPEAESDEDLEQRQAMIQEIHEKMQILDGDDYEKALKTMLDSAGARNLVEVPFRLLVKMVESVRDRREKEIKD